MPRMNTEPSGAGPHRRTRRLPPEERKRRLIEKATEFFSEEGFEAGTRELAQQMGITQPLIYRYFDSKDDLINEVYRKVYVDQWQDRWVAILRDRDVPLRDRLLVFYESYCRTIFNRRWMRIFFFAGLKGLDINNRYITRVNDKLLVPICEELRAHMGRDTAPPLSEAELELVWLMHGMIFYQGIRQHIYRAVERVDYDFAISTAVEMYLRTAPDVLERNCGPAPR